MSKPFGIRGGWVVGLLWVAASASAGRGQEFQLSPPVTAPAEPDRQLIHTQLRDLQDAIGLALLVEDGQAAQQIARIAGKWERDYQPLLISDPVLKKIDDRMQGLFAQSLTEQARKSSELEILASSLPREKLRPILVQWLRELFFLHQVTFPEDLRRLSIPDLEDICLQARAIDSLKGLPGWMHRALMWRYRDREVRRLFHDRDERMAFLTPIHLDPSRLDPATSSALRRYLTMLHNLKLQVLKNRTMPYQRFRTLDGLLRGLRYMDTIRSACELTGLDHRLMTRLFIQESEFVHQRVSAAGAYSLAQFLNIALEDVWQFRNRIAGAEVLLKGIGSHQQLKQKVIADPRMAIKASCLYFRRIRDEVVQRLAGPGRSSNSDLVALLTLEMFAMRQGVLDRSSQDSLAELYRNWPAKESGLFPLLPVAGGMVPNPGAVLPSWVEQTIRKLVHARISESVFQGRLNKLHSALGLAAYNAGMGNLTKSARHQAPFGSLSFPLQISETRNYVDDILDGIDILEEVDQLASEVDRLDYEELRELAGDACRLAGQK